MSAPRFVIEGTWSGYTSAQRQVAHRMVYPGARKRLRAWAEKTYAIRYTDGTCLILSVRDCKPRERVQENRSYRELIEDCAHYGVDSVEGFYAARDAHREASREKRALDRAREQQA